MSEPLLTVKQLCERTGLSRTKIYTLTRDRKIPHYRFGSTVKYDWAEIRAQLHVEAE